MSITLGSRKLNNFFEDNKRIKQLYLAAFIKKSEGYVSELKNGVKLPSLTTAKDIDYYTKGYVTIADWAQP